MKVLWLSVTPAMYDEQKLGGWIAALECIVQEQLKNYIELGIAFEYDTKKFKEIKNGITYYPINNRTSLVNGLKNKYSIENRWSGIKPQIIKAVEDFKPDIIHCFGSEWTYGAIGDYTRTPVVIHMQGFMNIYNLSSNLAYPLTERLRVHKYSPMAFLKFHLSKIRIANENEFEKKIMRKTKYFMGRTEWDKNIVHFFSPNAKYFYCPEALRNEIYNTEKTWQYEEDDMLRLITVTQANSLKGNEMILRTAKVLKEFGVKFNWRVAGRKEAFYEFEKKIGVYHQDVHIELLGMINATQIVNELSSARFYIHPAIIDNSPNSLCEAQIIGCPVIAANVGGIPSLVEEGETGFLYPYNEPYALAFLIMKLMHDREKLNYISENEIHVSRKRHDPNTISTTLMNIYNDIINEAKDTCKR